MHYGVLGMKWGQRRARKYAEKAKTQKEWAKDYNVNDYTTKLSPKQKEKMTKNKTKLLNKAKKYETKSKKIESYHRSMAGDKTYDLVKAKRTSTLVSESYILGTYGAFKYNQALAAGKSRGKSFVNAVGHTYLNALTGGAASVMSPRLNRKK